jgi:hypothetical protein
MHYCKYRLGLHGSTNTDRTISGSAPPSGVSVFSARAIILTVWGAVPLRERLRCFKILTLPLLLRGYILVTSAKRRRLLDVAYTCFLLTRVCLRDIGIDSSDDRRHRPSTAIFRCRRRLHSFYLVFGATICPHISIPFEYFLGGDIASIIEKSLVS